MPMYVSCPHNITKPQLLTLFVQSLFTRTPTVLALNKRSALQVVSRMLLVSLPLGLSASKLKLTLMGHIATFNSFKVVFEQRMRSLGMSLI